MLRDAQALLLGNKSSVAVNAINSLVEQLLSFGNCFSVILKAVYAHRQSGLNEWQHKMPVGTLVPPKYFTS